jgi:hypothetical protein
MKTSILQVLNGSERSYFVDKEELIPEWNPRSVLLQFNNTVSQVATHQGRRLVTSSQIELKHTSSHQSCFHHIYPLEKQCFRITKAL